MMINCTDLFTLLKGQPGQRKVIIDNMDYIPAEIMKGLVYLEQQKIQHGDMKGALYYNHYILHTKA